MEIFQIEYTLGKSVEDILDMVDIEDNHSVALKVDVSKIKLSNYIEQRNPISVFTYDNIPPSQIEVVG